MQPSVPLVGLLEVVEVHGGRIKISKRMNFMNLNMKPFMTYTRMHTPIPPFIDRRSHLKTRLPIFKIIQHKRFLNNGVM